MNEKFFKFSSQRKKEFSTSIMTSKIQNAINEIIRQYVTANPSISKFAKFSKSAELSISAISFENLRWNASKTDFFDSMYDDKFIKTDEIMKHAEKNTYFKDVHFFIERVSDIVTIHDQQLIRKNLFTCLRSTALQWYTSELSFEVKQLLRYDENINHWNKKLLKRFKKSTDVFINVILKERYTMKNARRNRKFREYAFKILRTIKFAKLKSISNQVAIIYNDFDIKFRRDFTKSINVITLESFFKEMNDFKKIWWQLTYRHFRNYRNKDKNFQRRNYESRKSFYSSNRNFFRNDEFYKHNTQFYSQRQAYDKFSQSYSQRQAYDEFSQSYSQRRAYDEFSQSYYQSYHQQFKTEIRQQSQISTSKQSLAITEISKQFDFRHYDQKRNYYNNRNKRSFRQKIFQTTVENENAENDFTYDEKKISINFAEYDETNNEFFYEKQTCDEMNETFADFIEIETVCKRCQKTFSFNNKLHVHLRFDMCFKKQKNNSFTNQTCALFIESIEIIKSNASFNDFEFDVEFRNWNFLKTVLKFFSTDEETHVCLDIECDATLCDKKFIINKLTDLQIQTMTTSLKVRDINFITHEINEFVMISIYFLDTNKFEKSALANITRKIHLIDDLKINMLIENDILELESFIIDVSKKTTTINNCEIIIDLFIRQRDLFVRRNILSNHRIIVSLDSQARISFDYNISEERNFLFELSIESDCTMFHHLINSYISEVVMQNDSSRSVIIFKKFCLRSVSKLTYDHCFQISKIDMTMQSSKKNWFDQSNQYSFNSIDIKNISKKSSNESEFNNRKDKLKIRLSNDIMIYENNETVFVYSKLLEEFSTLWKDEEFINVFNEHWMKISLIDDWQSKITEKFKIYSLRTEKRKIVDKIFDELHRQRRLKWTTDSILFFYFVFIAWKTSNDVRKSRAVVDIKKLNKLIVSDFYSLSLQSDIINDLRNCTHISVLDATIFFYQWRVHFDHIYRLTIVTHREQKTFLISVMKCKNSVTYVQRQMNTFLKYLIFAKIYIDDIIIKSKNMRKHMLHFRTVFKLFNKLNISIKSIKIFIVYSDVVLLKQKVNALNLIIIKEKLKAIAEIKFSETFENLKHYLKFTDYIRDHIYFYSTIANFLQRLKIELLKQTFNANSKKRQYASKIKITSIKDEIMSFNDFQQMLNKSSMLYHFHSQKQLWIDLNSFKQFDFEMIIFHLKNDIIIVSKKWSSRTSILSIMYFNRQLTKVEQNYWITKFETTNLVWTLKKVKHLIQLSEHKTIIHIDHQVVINICEQILIIAINSIIRMNIRLVKASQFFNQFNFDVKYKSKKEHIISDVLFRLISSNINLFSNSNHFELNALYAYNTTFVELSTEFRDRIIQDYIDDSIWKKIRKLIIINQKLSTDAVNLFFSINLETSAEIDSYFESRTQHSSIMISNDVNSLDLLYHTDKLTDFKRLFIFSSCIKNILQITHDDDQSEFAKCFEIVSKAWYIRELIKHLRDFIKHCSQCLTLQIRRHKSFDSLQFINSSSVSFHIIILNFILTLSKIDDDIDIIMSITNKFTKRITMLTDKVTYNVEQWALALLDRLNIVDWEYSKIIISNRNRKFLSDLWKTIFNRLSINLLYSTFYHFQTNDSSERINQTAEIVLRYYIHDLKKFNLWSKTLSMFQVVMNNSRSSTTIKTFNEIFYEFISNRSLNLIRHDNVKLNENLFQDRIEIKNAIFWANMNYKMHYDRKHTSMFLKVEEWTLIKLHHDYNISFNLNIIKKLTQQFVRSFKVIKKIDNLAYQLNTSADWKIHSVFFVAQFESSSSSESDSYDRFRSNNLSSIYVEENIDNVKSYEMKKIFNKKTIKRDREQFIKYFIRWKNYDLEFDRWYNIKEFDNVNDLVKKYDEQISTSRINSFIDWFVVYKSHLDFLSARSTFVKTFISSNSRFSKHFYSKTRFQERISINTTDESVSIFSKEKLSETLLLHIFLFCSTTHLSLLFMSFYLLASVHAFLCIFLHTSGRHRQNTYSI